MRSTLSVLAASLVLAAGAGCGDDDEPAAGGTTTAGATTETPAATATTHEDHDTQPEPSPELSRWALDVDAACAPLQQQIDALPPPSDAASLGTWLQQALPLVRKQVAAVKGVPPPAEEDEAERTEFFAESLAEVEQGLERYRAALAKNDGAAAQQALTEAGAAGAKARAQASTLGVTECGGYSGS